MTQYGNVIRLSVRAPSRPGDLSIDVRDMAAAGQDASSANPIQEPDLGTVVPFARPRSGDSSTDHAPNLRSAGDARPAPASSIGGRGLMLGFILCSALVHAGVCAVLNREPPPMAGLETDAISVEIVLDVATPAAPAATASEPDTSAADIQKDPQPQPEPPVAAAASEPPQHEPQSTPEPVAEPPAAQLASPAPPEPAAEIAPVLAPAAPKPPEPKRAAQPPKRPEKPVPQKPGKAAPRIPANDRRIAMRTPAGEPSTASRAASAPAAAGPGRADAEAKYRGLVAAHLNHYKQFPAEAHDRQGVPVVSFGLDGHGRVTRVALARGSGISSFDQEAQAMVRRASPFPAPPEGRSMSFTVPVSFHR